MGAVRRRLPYREPTEGREGRHLMNTKKIELNVANMTCPSCVGHVNRALAEVDGVTKVEMRLREGKVLVQYDPTVADVSTLVEALRDAGYESTPSAAA
jgi:copper chaperone